MLKLMCAAIMVLAVSTMARAEPVDLICSDPGLQSARHKASR
jgi:hypothetical protein